MIDEKFARGNSFIHKIDPVVRILAAIFLSFATALCDRMSFAVVYLLISIILVAMARLNPGDVFKRIKPLFWFLLMIWVILPVTFGWGPGFYLYGLKISFAGIVLCWKITLKSIAILLMFTALLTTMSMASLGNGMHRIHVPDKMVFLILMSYRYISVIEKEYQKLLRAAKLRGFKPGTNMHSYKTFAYLAGMLFVRASIRADRVHKAMMCRGFNQKFHTLDVYAPNRMNSVFLIGIFLAGTCLVILEFLWN